MSENINTKLVVLGSGPGGYSAAFRAADLGIDTVLVEYFDALGGVCLNVGCIPSKALLHNAKVIDEVPHLSQQGVDFGNVTIDHTKMRNWIKTQVIGKLTGGLKMMAKQRKVNVVHGYGKFINDNCLEVEKDGKKTLIKFEQAIVAAGSKPITLPFLPQDDRIIDSTGALEMKDVPQRMLVLGGGIIGLEMATVYATLGSAVSVVEMMPGLMGDLDKDLVKPMQKILAKKCKNIYLKTKVIGVEATNKELVVEFEKEDGTKFNESFDKILVAIGRKPNGKLIGLENTGVHVDDRGFIAVDKQMRTNLSHIFAIGDIVGDPMLAHKAVHEGRVAAEVVAGKKHYFDAKVIPSVAYTDPEVAWVGFTEDEAKKENINYGIGKFPWMASGRAISQGRTEGLTKLIFNKDNGRIIGAGIVGTNAGELIAEMALAIEMGCDVEDVALTIHPHPTLSETVALAAEVFEGTVTDLYIPSK